MSKALDLGDELADNPDKENDPEIAARTLVQIIKIRETALRAAIQSGDFRTTLRVNGGTFGLSTFTDTFNRGKAALNNQN
jgi:predicted chitinase